jgi:vacuolar-type H+-ATPase subunit C/Vma6
MDVLDIETRLDIRYFQELEESAGGLKGEDRALAERILSDEISLRNCSWALRLRAYYQKSSADTSRHLTHYREARQALDLPLDTRAPWEGWKWEKFLNPEESGRHWVPDPRYFQNAASAFLYKFLMNSFHRMPQAVNSIYCFIKLKQYEEDILISIAEGLSLGMESEKVFNLMGAR